MAARGFHIMCLFEKENVKMKVKPLEKNSTTPITTFETSDGRITRPN